MKALKKIGGFVKNKSLELLLAGALTLTPIACKKHKNPIVAPEGPPVISTLNLQDAIEKQAYSFQLTATDPNNDPITYSKTSGPAFIDVDSIGRLYNASSLTDAISDRNYSITIKAEDNKGNYTEKTFNLNVQGDNTKDVSGNVKDITDESNISGIEVIVGPSSGFTDVNGDYVIQDVPDGDNSVTIQNINYVTHQAGTLIVNSAKKLENKLNNINFKTIPSSFNMIFFNQVARGYGATQKFLTAPRFYVYLGDGVTYLNPTIAERDMAISIIENDLPRLTNGFINATIANGRIIVDDGTNVPLPVGVDGWVIFYWVNPGGGHGEDLVGNEIKRSQANVVPGDNIGVYREELGQACSGIRNDSDSVPDSNDTIFNSLVPNSTIDFTSLDCLTGKIIQERPIGNTSPDNNPAGYVINP